MEVCLADTKGERADGWRCRGKVLCPHTLSFRPLLGVERQVVHGVARCVMVLFVLLVCKTVSGADDRPRILTSFHQLVSGFCQQETTGREGACAVLV